MKVVLVPPPKRDAIVFTIDFPYSFVTKRRPKGWALLWLRIRYFFPNLIWPLKVWWWKRTGQWED